MSGRRGGGVGRRGVEVADLGRGRQQAGCALVAWEGGAVAHLLSAEDLHCRGGLLGEVHERAGVRDQSRADELAHHRRQVGRDRLAAHAPRVSVCMCRVHVP